MEPDKQTGTAQASMHLIRITDPDDPRVAAFRDIRERDLVGRQGLFVAEGKVVLNVLLAVPGFETLSLLLLENRVAGLSDLLARVPPETPVHVADARVIDAIAGFHIHRGILALGRRRTPAEASDLLEGLPRRALVLVLAGISNHDNVGSIFRNAAAFGVDAVFLDASCCDPLYRKAIRVSVGGVFRAPFARFEHIDDFLGLLGRFGFQPVALSPRGETDIGALQRQDRMALLLGTEGEGLPEALLSRMETARIAMASGFDSLNVAAASAIALHRLADARPSA
jgi:tRNA G18 (ribose-2'-O)-methylase SpoU